VEAGVHMTASADQLTRNPFDSLIPPPPVEPVAVEDPEVPEDPPVEVEPAEQAPSLAGVEIGGTLDTSRGATVSINGIVYSVGDRIRGWTIQEIHSRYIVVKWKDQTKILRQK
jgi:hypothetical protein